VLCVSQRRKRRRVTVSTVTRRDISSVTSDDLKRVATFVSEKRYNAKFVSDAMLY